VYARPFRDGYAAKPEVIQDILCVRLIGFFLIFACLRGNIHFYEMKRKLLIALIFVSFV